MEIMDVNVGHLDCQETNTGRELGAMEPSFYLAWLGPAESSLIGKDSFTSCINWCSFSELACCLSSTSKMISLILPLVSKENVFHKRPEYFLKAWKNSVEETY